MPVPDAQVKLRIAGVLTDVTDDVMAAPGIQLSRGRSDEGRVSDPGAGSLTLKSDNGKYSNRNPNSPYFGLLGRNTELQVSVAGAATVLDVPHDTAGRASTPDHASLDITGDIDVRAELQPEMWAGSIANSFEVIGKYNTTGNQRSWRFLVTASGRLALTWSTTGANLIEHISTKSVDFGPWERGAIRVTLDVDNGSGGYTITWYTAESLAGPWTVLDQLVTTSGTTSVFSSTAPLEVGDISSLGFDNVARRVHRAEVRNGIGGAVVAAPDFTVQAPGTTSFADSAGRTWTVAGGASITDRRTLAVHEVPKWPARWHRSGHGVVAPITSAGVLRRLGQGRKALASTLRRRIPSDPSLIAYWPMEEGESATQAYSTIPSVLPMTTAGLDWAADDSLAGSSALPKLQNPASVNGIIPRSTAIGWHVECVYFLPAMPAAQTEILRVLVAGSVLRFVSVYASTAGIKIEGRDGEDNILATATFSTAAAIADFWGVWNRLQLYTVDRGAGTMHLVASWRDITASSYWFAQTGTFTASMGQAAQVKTTWGAATEGMTLGHLAAFDVPGTWDGANSAPGTTIFNNADDGFTNESALTRLARLAGEESSTVQLDYIDGDVDRVSESMGPQKPKPFLDLLQEPADTDGGFLYENGQRLGLLYRDRTSMENQRPKLVVPYGKITHPFEPDEDDLRLRNDITVSRDGGSEGRAVAVDGPLGTDTVGTYDESVTLSMAKDSRAQPIAGWRLHHGTWDEARYPAVTILLHRHPELIDAVTSLELGDRIQITDTPPWQPPGPVDLIVQRIDHDLKPVAWTVRLVCSPTGPWTVGVVGDAVLGKADTAGSELTAAVSSSATTLMVLATSGETWTRDPAEVPWDATVGGETVTATAVRGGAEDDFSAAASSSWGTADIGGAWGQGGGSATDYNVTGGRGTHTLATVNTSRRTFLPWTVPDVDVQVDIQTSALATGGALTGGLTARYVGSDDLYTARLAFGTTQVITLTIRKRVAGAETELGTYTVPLTHAANTDVRLRFRVFGDQLAAKAWAPAAPEPRDWQIVVTDTSQTTSSFIGCRSISLTGNTNVNPLVRYDNFVVLNPTTWTVTRSVNGIVKAQSAGESIRLANPMRAAL